MEATGMILIRRLKKTTTLHLIQQLLTSFDRESSQQFLYISLSLWRSGYIYITHSEQLQPDTAAENLTELSHADSIIQKSKC